MLPWRTLAVVALAASAAALAGCSARDDGAATDATQDLAADRGGIEGLLVDDRYRPIHLVEQPTSEFQARGFLLVVETGETLGTDANGLFTLTDLVPGTFTLKPAVEGHEGAPVKVDVVAGQYAEVDVLVRRLVTLGEDTIVIHDDTVLVTCSMQVTNGHLSFGRACHGDLSDEGQSSFVDYNYTQFGKMAAIVVEVELSRTGDYEFWFSKQLDVIQLEGDLYRKVFGFGTDYIRFSALDGADGDDWAAPLNMSDLRIWVNVNGIGSKETYDATGLAIGADFTFVVEARLVVSAFLRVPDDLETYAVLR